MAEYFHPEFGYLYPTPRFRHDLRLALVAFASGAALGAIAIVTVNVNYGEVEDVSPAGAANNLAAGTETKSHSTPGLAALEQRSHHVDRALSTEAKPSSNPEPETSGSGATALTAKPLPDSVQTNASLCADSASKPSCMSERPSHATPSANDNGSLLARVPPGQPGSRHGASSMPTSQPTEPSNVPHVAPETFPSPRAAARGGPRLAGAAQQKNPRKTAGRPRPKEGSGGGPAALASPQDTSVNELGANYARSNGQRRTVFWDWSR